LAGTELAVQLAEQIYVQQKTAGLRATVPAISDGVDRLDRQQFFSVLSTWLTENRCDHLVICDATFAQEDLDFLRFIRTAKSVRHISIVTSKGAQTPPPEGLDLEQAYGAYWKDHVSDQRPPTTRFVLLGKETQGTSPIDRTLILGDTGGLELQNSIRKFGTERPDELRRLEASDIEKLLEMVEDYASGKLTEQNGHRIRCSTFTL
jgi:hypothetical protein